jgi:hypothetical protein
MSGKQGNAEFFLDAIPSLRVEGTTPAGVRRGYLTGNSKLDRCTCDCHRYPGVKHCVPCCSPASQDPFDIQREQDTPLFQPERG